MVDNIRRIWYNQGKIRKGLAPWPIPRTLTTEKQPFNARPLCVCGCVFFYVGQFELWQMPKSRHTLCGFIAYYIFISAFWLKIKTLYQNKKTNKKGYKPMKREQQATTNKNKIPRHFLRITAQAEKATSASNTGDMLHIFKNDFGYLV